MKLNSTHPFLSTSPEIAEFIKPLEKIGITYFNYSKSEADGSRIYLQNDASFLENFLENKYYSIAPCESHPSNYNSEIIHWSTLSDQRSLNDLVRSRDVDHGIFIFEPHEDYCESYAFATTRDNYAIINTYLSNMETIKNFISQFKENAKTILNRAEQHKITLPYHHQPLKINKSYPAIQSMPNLTHRQLECINLIVQGKTAKEIAIDLHLSQRTVEYYLNNIKTKLGCRNKSQLIAVFSHLLKQH